VNEGNVRPYLQRIRLLNDMRLPNEDLEAKRHKEFWRLCKLGHIRNMVSSSRTKIDPGTRHWPLEFYRDEQELR
jgi:hypothetical protein